MLAEAKRGMSQVIASPVRSAKEGWIEDSGSYDGGYGYNFDYEGFFGRGISNSGSI